MVRKTDTTDGGMESKTITTTYRPMSTEAPTLEEEIEALKLRIAILERNCRMSHGARQLYVPGTIS